MHKLVWVRADQREPWQSRRSFVSSAIECNADVVVVKPSDVPNVLKMGAIAIATSESVSGANIVVLEMESSNKIDSVIKDIEKFKSEGKQVAVHIDVTDKEMERASVFVGTPTVMRLQPSEIYQLVKNKEMKQASFLAAGSADFLIISAPDWKIIPLENIIAELQGKPVKILAEVKDAEEAKVAVETLEVGAAGIVLGAKEAWYKTGLGAKKTGVETGRNASEIGYNIGRSARETGESWSNEIKKVCNFMKKMPILITRTPEVKLSLQIVPLQLELVVAKVKEVKPVGSGDRACIDTTSLMNIGEGMLVGSQAGGLFLVHSESLQSEFVEPRPFRVNAGAVHAYVSVPGGRTKYMSELKAGEDVLIVNADGTTRVAVVGRVKIERRPLMLVEAEYGGEIYKTLLQNAETINLVGEDGKPVSVTKLKPGDKILLHVQKGGRHFGAKVEEMLVER